MTDYKVYVRSNEASNYTESGREEYSFNHTDVRVHPKYEVCINGINNYSDIIRKIVFVSCLHISLITY